MPIDGMPFVRERDCRLQKVTPCAAPACLVQKRQTGGLRRRDDSLGTDSVDVTLD